VFSGLVFSYGFCIFFSPVWVCDFFSNLLSEFFLPYSTLFSLLLCPSLWFDGVVELASDDFSFWFEGVTELA